MQIKKQNTAISANNILIKLHKYHGSSENYHTPTPGDGVDNADESEHSEDEDDVENLTARITSSYRNKQNLLLQHHLTMSAPCYWWL